MAPPTFTVFVDEPVSAAAKRRHSATTKVATSASGSTTSSKALPGKENIDPLTGLRAGTEETARKKRKTVLATKLPNPATRKSKVSKRRKASTKGKGASSNKESKDGSASRKAAGGKPSRKRFASMPPVDETADAMERMREADVAAKCYDLTVMPLADVSEAFGEGSRWEATPEIARVQSQGCDSPDSYHASSRLVRSRAPSPEPQPFTFSSPSKSGERFRRTRTSPISSDAELYRL